MFLTKKFTLADYLRYSGALGNFTERLINRETFAMLSYFIIYLIYSFFSSGAEYFLWITLVLLPFTFLYYIQRKSLIIPSIKLSLAFFGLRKSNLSNGVFAAVIIGILISVIKVLAAGDEKTVLKIASSPSALYLLPFAFIIILLTVGFTEEFFFRGVMQTRIVRLVKSNVLGIIFTSIMYGIYRLPYYYLSSSVSGFPASDSSFFVFLSEGIVAGLVIGYIYFKSNENLLSAVILHTMMMILPVMVTIKMNWF